MHHYVICDHIALLLSHSLSSDSVSILVERVWKSAHLLPGPVHLNLPIEETLHPSLAEQDSIFSSFSFDSNNQFKNIQTFVEKGIGQEVISNMPLLDPCQPGVVVAGPWRGTSDKLYSFQRRWLQRLHELQTNSFLPR